MCSFKHLQLNMCIAHSSIQTMYEQKFLLVQWRVEITCKKFMPFDYTKSYILMIKDTEPIHTYMDGNENFKDYS